MAFATGEERTESGNDGGEDAEAFVDSNAVGNKTADTLRSAGGFGQGRVELTGCLHNVLAGSLQFPTCRLFPLPQGKENVGGIENTAHDAASSSSSSS